MRLKKFVLIAVFAFALLAVCGASAAYKEPRTYPQRDMSLAGTYVTGMTCSRLAINSGPGTRRFFDELGTYGRSGEYVRIYAKAWDPNNGIWWLKVEYPTGSGFTGWTGLKRFYATTFDLEKVPTEVWY